MSERFVRNLFIAVILILISSCSQFLLGDSKQRFRTLAHSNALNCNEAIAFIVDAEIQSPRVRAFKYISNQEVRGFPIHIDIGGEGRYADALNINPSKFTSTTGEPGQLIPNWIYGRADELPLPSGSVHRLTVESAPINNQAILEILRVMRPRGQIDLYHPTDYAETVHKEIVQELRKAGRVIDVLQERDDVGVRTIIQIFD